MLFFSPVFLSETVPEGVRPLVPAQLTPDAVGDGGDELSAQAELGAKLQSKLLWGVLPLRHVPLKLVHQRDVPDVDVQLEHKNITLLRGTGGLNDPQYELQAEESVERHLDDDPLVRLVLQDAVCRIRLDLLSDGGGDGRDEGQRVEVQVVAEDLSEHLRCHELL